MKWLVLALSMGFVFPVLAQSEGQFCRLGAEDYQECIERRCAEINQQGVLCGGQIRGYGRGGGRLRSYSLRRNTGFWGVTPPVQTGFGNGTFVPAPIAPPTATPMQPTFSIQPVPRLP